jgi:heat shock protein Hsp15
VAGQRAKSSRALRTGDTLVVTRGDDVFEIEVLALSDKRGSATVAQALYAESEASRARRAAALAARQAERAGYQAPQSRPDKRARRLIRALGDIDAL